jgi:hypothetical protein
MRRNSWDVFVSYREANILLLRKFIHEFGGEEEGGTGGEVDA